MCATGLGMRVCVFALSQQLYITFVHQTRIKRSVRPWLSLHREQGRGAWGGGGGAEGSVAARKGGGAPPTVASGAREPDGLGGGCVGKSANQLK